MPRKEVYKYAVNGTSVRDGYKVIPINYVRRHSQFSHIVRTAEGKEFVMGEAWLAYTKEEAEAILEEVRENG